MCLVLFQLIMLYLVDVLLVYEGMWMGGGSGGKERWGREGGETAVRR